jgi:hypothetical protein
MAYRVRLNRIVSETSMRDAVISGGKGGSCAPRTIEAGVEIRVAGARVVVIEDAAGSVDPEP